MRASIPEGQPCSDRQVGKGGDDERFIAPLSRENKALKEKLLSRAARRTVCKDVNKSDMFRSSPSDTAVHITNASSSSRDGPWPVLGERYSELKVRGDTRVYWVFLDVFRCFQ